MDHKETDPGVQLKNCSKGFIQRGKLVTCHKSNLLSRWKKRCSIQVLSQERCTWRKQTGMIARAHLYYPLWSPDCSYSVSNSTQRNWKAPEVGFFQAFRSLRRWLSPTLSAFWSISFFFISGLSKNLVAIATITRKKSYQKKETRRKRFWKTWVSELSVLH